MLVLVPSLGILLFNHSSLFDAVITTVLVPSLGILLFNDTKAGLSEKKGRQFSSPLWGFFYLMIEKNCYIVVKKLFSSPLWGFFYLILGRKTFKALFPFSSPLWGFFYLIFKAKSGENKITVLVPSLGILLFNEQKL